MFVLAEMPGVPTIVFLAALALTIGILLLRTQRYYARSASRWSSLESLRPAAPQPREPIQPPNEVAQWEVQMHETARGLLGQLDSKMGVLEQLIREADRAAARLEAAQRMASGEDGQDPYQPLRTQAAKEDPYHPISQAEGLRPAALVGRDSSIVPAGQEPAGKRPPRDRRYEEIYTLADYGYDVVEIAHRTNTPVGEVQLILSLREGRK